MIRCVITSSEASHGIKHVVQKLRAAGIPARTSCGSDIRLCPEWDAPADATIYDNCKLLGYGRLEWTEDCISRDVEFRYYPPPRPDENPWLKAKPDLSVVYPDAIDVEARIVRDTPLILTNPKQQ